MNTIRKKFFNGWLTLCLAVAVLCTPMHVSAVSAPLVDALPTDGDMALSFVLCQMSKMATPLS